MADDKVEKRIEFIIEQQAQFAADIQQLREGMQELRESQSKTDQMLNRLAAVTLEGFKDVNAKLDALVDSHIGLADSHERLSAAQERTDETLRTLIAVVDRYFQNQNGKSEG